MLDVGCGMEGVEGRLRRWLGGLQVARLQGQDATIRAYLMQALLLVPLYNLRLSTPLDTVQAYPMSSRVKNNPRFSIFDFRFSILLILLIFILIPQSFNLTVTPAVPFCSLLFCGGAEISVLPMRIEVQSTSSIEQSTAEYVHSYTGTPAHWYSGAGAGTGTDLQ